MNLKRQEIGQNAVAGRRAETAMGAAMAAVFGVLLIGFVGFSHVEAVHNAAHDTRHSNGFPCH